MAGAELDPWRQNVPGVAAHRGGRAIGPENTIAGILEGLGEGATHVEVDVRGTEDGHAVCHHDETAERTCRVERAIDEMTLEELRELDPCRLWSEHAGIATGEVEPPSGMSRSHFQIPLLEDALEAFPGVPFILDVKDTAPLDAIADAIDEGYQRPEDLLLGGYDDDLLARLGEQVPDVPRGPGLEQGRAFYGGEDIDADAIVVPLEHEGVELVAPEIVDRAHGQGKGFWVWTINEVDRARELFAMGVDGVITDHPGKIARERNRTLGG
jgi:glycerophosphoryl diester phosphodiesterase